MSICSRIAHHIDYANIRLPIRHDKVSYELVVVNLEPSDEISLVNTDLEVDLLPSERAQYEQEKRARASEAAAETALALAQQSSMRAERAEQIRESLPDDIAPDTPDSVMLLVRLPKGKFIILHVSTIGESNHSL